MSRIAQMFERRAGRTALIPYVTAGYPSPEWTVPLMRSLTDNGGDLIEVGVPFSDPMADGPVIQAACYGALQNHVGLKDVLDMVAAFRESDDETPIVLMSYCNPVLAMGVDKFADAAASVGVDGLLPVDLPPEDGVDLTEAVRSRGLDTVFLVSPTTTAERGRAICDATSGFVYYVSLKGVTGAGHLDSDAVDEGVRALKRTTDLPVAVGFGVTDAESAKRVARLADGVVVGSAIVKRAGECFGRDKDASGACKEIGEWLATIRSALDN